MMTWNPQANELFLRAIEYASPDEQRRFLDGACDGDAALRAEVEGLLAAGAQAGSFLDMPANGAYLAATIQRPIAEQPGTMIGPYKLLEQIGEGGFGVVFMAEQQQPVRRKVALKVLKPGMDTRQVVARFEAERQALALMDHPNIARVFDGGTTTTGRPYFVMELVRGVPITEFCDQSCRSIRERLALFVDVCQAVQHAHQKGVIHRDIKPSNVLVTLHDGTPVVKVIDFGVAKAMGQQLTEKTLFTNFAQMVGTPLYMSPEQAEMSGLDIDTRSDIYSLGVLLYELLTGTTPFENERLSKVGYDEMRRIIREEEPPKPSTRISTVGNAASTACEKRQSNPRKLSRLFRGELDWIAIKALEKDRKRRYETANAFAVDVERYLGDEQVVACPPSAIYRFSKFARRNKAGLAIAGLCLSLVVLIGGGAGWLVRDRAAREQAVDGELDRALIEAEWRMRDLQWPETMAIVERTEKLLEAAGRHEIPARLQQLRKDLAMIRRLDEVDDAEQDAFWISHESDQQYAEAFQQYGVDFKVLSVAEAAQRIRASNIRRQLARSLDYWALVRRLAANSTRPDSKQLLEVAELADGDGQRNKLRRSLRDDDRKALAQLAASPDLSQLPVDTLTLVRGFWNTLGITRYRAGSWAEAADALTKSMQVFNGGDGIDWFLLAMADWQLGNRDGARAWYDRGARWMDYRHFDEARRLHLEAAALLGVHDDAVLTSRARMHICRNRWNEAAKEYASSSDLLSDGDKDRRFEYACLLLLLGDTNGYRSFCQRMIDRHGSTTDSFAGYELSRTCAVSRDPMVTSDRLVQWAKRAARDRPDVPWNLHALGLAYYRSGQFQAAVDTLQRSPKVRWHTGGDALNEFILALAHHQLGHTDEARDWLAKAQKRIAQLAVAPSEPVNLPAPDWLEIQLLRSEAEALVRKP